MGGCCVDGVKNAFKNDALLGDCDVLIFDLTRTVILDTDKLRSDCDVHARVLKILDEIGFVSKLLDDVDNMSESMDDVSEFEENTAEATAWSHKHKGALGLVSGFFLLFLPLFVTGMPWVLTVMLASASLGLTVALGWSFYRHAYLGLWKGNWTMDTLFSISTGTILLVSVAALFVPGLPMMFEAGLLIFGFRHAGLAIEEAFKANFSTTTRLQDDTALPPEVVCEDGRIISRDKIKKDDVFHVFPGKILPVDGEFVLGAGFTSNKYKHGSERLTALVCHEKLDAGTKLMSVSDGQSLLFKASAPARDSFLAQEDKRILKAKIKRAQENPSPKPNTTAYMLQFFIPAVVAVALLSGMIVGVYFSSWVLALQCVSSVLVAACPCTFGLITPLVIQVGINQFKREDVSFRIPEHLETAAAVDCVVFDLNGTLTEGEPKVQGYSSEEILALMSALEEGEPHAMAGAIRKAYAGERVAGRRELISRERMGIRVKLDDVDYVLGNQHMMEQKGIAVEVPKVGSCENVVYLASNGVVMGHVVLEDKLRSEARTVMQELQNSRKNIRLYTGSDQATAYRYATALKIDINDVVFDCETDGEHSKQGYVKALQAEGHTVAMIGDYTNDASAIAASDFGLAVAHAGGHVAAQEAASAVIHDDSLLSVLQVFKTAERTVEHINQNLGFNLIYNALAVLAPMGVLFATGVMMSPAVGAALMILQTLLIFANVYRFSCEDAPEIMPESGTRYGNADVAGIRNGEGFTYAHGDRLDSKVALNRVDDTKSDGFDESKRMGFH
jgi:Cu2+-exporting ATPase